MVEGCRSTYLPSKVARLWNIKHSILKAFSQHQHLCEVLYLHLEPLIVRERSKMEDKAPLGDEER